MTNFEKIKAMSIEELAGFIFDTETENHKYYYEYCMSYCPCYSFVAPHCSAGTEINKYCILARKKWLEREADRDDDN